MSAVERAGGKVEEALLSGKVAFRIGDKSINCSIVEKMIKPVGRWDEQDCSWTAYPEHHQTGLLSSGYLRVTITTPLPMKQPQWVETEAKRLGDILPEIIGGIFAAEARLVESERDREESARRDA
ncbi:MAG: hypothetical protein JO001_21500 [Alphaproteobacteria bacterium]|nr:hypothetical protein [Alphaproteobacteria bacterium]